MKKILLIAAAFVFAVSCSDWGSETPQVSAKFVEKLEMSDGSTITFTYGDNGFANRIENSNGKSYTLDFNYTDNRNFVIKVNDGTGEQLLNVKDGFLVSTSVDGQTVSTFSYDPYGNLSQIVNQKDYARSNVQWLGGSYVLLPMSQSNYWFEDEALSSTLYGNVIAYNWNDSNKVFNVYANLNFLPLLVPEYVECSDVDPIIMAALGALRTYYLPSSVAIRNVRDALNPSEGTLETRVFGYDCDSTGYVDKVYSTDALGVRKLLFSVVYRTVNSATPSSM